MKICLIYGQDGLDMDVVYNLRSFYRKSGFKVIYSRKLHRADLLVITRALEYVTDFSFFPFPLIHIYNYTGQDYSSLLKSVDISKAFVFCTCESIKAQIIENSNLPGERVFVALPPVDTFLWCKKLKEIKYHIVHIGNHKDKIESDIFRKRFLQLINIFNVHVWGRGWNKSLENYHGKAGLFRVSSVYSRSDYALGLMYPFQREITYSGRFWHAPLNGCYLLSEPGYFTDKIPGIVVSDYSTDDLQNKTAQKYDRKRIQQESIQFWEAQNKILFTLTGPSLENIAAQNHGISWFLEFLYVKIHNILFTAYQRSGLSAFILRK